MMQNTENKLDVLCAIAQRFNGEGLLWAVGASLLLYFEGIVQTFNDIDVMVHEGDALKAKEILLSMGRPLPADQKPQYTTKHFWRFDVDGVEVDVMGGLSILFVGKEYDCALQADQIAGYTSVSGTPIPLHALSLWKTYYRLMGRDEKAALIEKSLR